jgi:tRNA A-37 threonylcarbamoyl transferase component Bud32
MKHDFCRSQVYELVQSLHRIGIVHGDLEPRNIARARGGGFCLIDFSESRRHICKESKVRYATTSLSWLLTCK